MGIRDKLGHEWSDKPAKNGVTFCHRCGCGKGSPESKARCRPTRLPGF